MFRAPKHSSYYILSTYNLWFPDSSVRRAVGGSLSESRLASVCWLCYGWDLQNTAATLVVLRINVDLAIFQPYPDLEAGDNQSLKIHVARPGIEPRSSCSASQELNHSATVAPEINFGFTLFWHFWDITFHLLKLQWRFDNPGIYSPEISLVRTKSAGTISASELMGNSVMRKTR